MDKVKQWLRFDHSVVSEAMNRAGGMCLLWKDDVTVLATLQTAFTIEAKIGGGNSQDEWWFIGVYASCDSQIRK